MTESGEITGTTTSDGIRVAHARRGTGPPLLMLFPYHINDLVLNGDVPLHRHAMSLFAERFTLVNVDLRGAGRSDREIHELTLERMTMDLVEVLDDLRFVRTAICALGDSALLAASLATTEPHRVGSMVLVEAGDSEENRQVFALRQTNRELGAEARAGLIGGLGDPQNTAALTRLMKSAVGAEQFEMYRRLVESSDLAALLGPVTTPTLFVHAQDDQLIPAETASRLAGPMPDATVMLIPGTSGIATWRDDRIIDTIARFLEGDRDAATGFSVSSTTPRIRLTKREEEILGLVAQGKTNPQIADELFISSNTVSHHLRGIFAKTGSGNRTEAAAFALRNGLGGNHTIV